MAATPKALDPEQARKRIELFYRNAAPGKAYVLSVALLTLLQDNPGIARLLERNRGKGNHELATNFTLTEIVELEPIFFEFFSPLHYQILSNAYQGGAQPVATFFTRRETERKDAAHEQRGFYFTLKEEKDARFLIQRDEGMEVVGYPWF